MAGSWVTKAHWGPTQSQAGGHNVMADQLYVVIYPVFGVVRTLLHQQGASVACESVHEYKAFIQSVTKSPYTGEIFMENT